MVRQNTAAPVIIKRKKIVAGAAHHGGAWKVAFADFATAMMAFFLMMWLLGATSESQRRGLADYFNPTVPIHRISSGGSGMFGGDDIESPVNMGPTTASETAAGDPSADPSAHESEGAFAEVERRLEALGGESTLMREALRHVMTRVTDEGLVIELFDLPDAPVFAPETAEPMPVMDLLAAVLADVLTIVVNPLAIEGHTRRYPVVQRVDPGWPLSQARPRAFQASLESRGLDPQRVARITGHADRRPVHANPMAVRNNRLEVIVLRQM